MVDGFWLLLPNKFLGFYHFYIILGHLAIAIWTFYKACSVEPGIITRANEKKYVEKYNQYYDGVMFIPKHKCETCKLKK